MQRIKVRLLIRLHTCILHTAPHLTKSIQKMEMKQDANQRVTKYHTISYLEGDNVFKAF
jgi:hypothetical protein